MEAGAAAVEVLKSCRGRSEALVREKKSEWRGEWWNGSDKWRGRLQGLEDGGRG